jgi:hypothetical protein
VLQIIQSALIAFLKSLLANAIVFDEVASTFEEVVGDGFEVDIGDKGAKGIALKLPTLECQRSL